MLGSTPSSSWQLKSRYALCLLITWELHLNAQIHLPTNLNHSKCQVPSLMKCSRSIINNNRRTSAEVGAKSRGEVKRGPGLNNNFMVVSSHGRKNWCWFNSGKKRASTCLLEPHIHNHRPSLLHESWFLYYIHLLYKSHKYWASTHQTKFLGCR